MSHILIVDDDPDLRAILQLFLGTASYVVREAVDATSALDSIRLDPPTVALLDVHMPGANGLWLADQVRKVSPTTAMILTTGDSHVSPLDTLRPGIVSYLVKPFDRTTLLRAVEEALLWSASATDRAEREAAFQALAGPLPQLSAPLK